MFYKTKQKYVNNLVELACGDKSMHCSAACYSKNQPESYITVRDLNH